MSEIRNLLERYLGPPRGGGEELRYLCPFHKETSPSFYVSAATGVSFCHACNKGRSFPQLLKDLGADYRFITAATKFILPHKKSASKKALASQPVVPLPEELMGVFRWCPGELLAAGFDKDILRVYEVGFDLIHNCPVYPIRDHLGRLVAISGRFENSYMLYGPTHLQPFLENPPKGKVNKSWFLWNLHNIYPEVFHLGGTGPVILTEGFKACLWCIQHGYPNTVALMGSYLSDEQTEMLLTLGSDIILFLDQDTAGQNGVERAIKALKESRQVRVAKYPRSGKLQPDALNQAEITEAIEASQLSYRRTK